MGSPPLERRYFISDLHIAHDKLAHIRGWSDAEAYWKELKEAWNDNLKSDDVVYILGDVVMKRKAIPLLSELKGSKRIVLGNHDLWEKDLRELPCVKTCSVVMSPKHGVILSHFPVHPGSFTHSRLGWRNIHGHLHDLTIEDDRYFNVSVEQVGLTPVSYDYVNSKLGKRTNVV